MFGKKKRYKFNFGDVRDYFARLMMSFALYGKSEIAHRHLDYLIEEEEKRNRGRWKMRKNKAKIRYKYRPSKEGVQLEKIKCPVCDGEINWIKSIQNYAWNGDVVLLAECWSGEIGIERPQHLFLIKICDGCCPVVELKKPRGDVSG